MSGSTSIQGRLLVLAGAGVLVAAGVLALLSRSSLHELEGEIALEHGRLARFASGAVSTAIADDLRLLATLADSPQIDLGDLSTGSERATLESGIPHARLWSAVFVVDESGQPVAAAPAFEQRLFESNAVREAAARAVGAQRTVVTPALAAGDNDRAVMGIVPFRPSEGRPGGAVAGVIRLPSRRLTALLQDGTVGPRLRLELVDETQAILASTTAAPNVEAAGSPTAAVEGTPWSIVVRNAGPDALGPVARFRRQSLWLAPSLAGLAMLLAWGIARSVRRPLRELTASAERIARGDLDYTIDTPGSTAGGDEIDRLATAVERMRGSLKRSFDEIERANQELESRVQDRTRELNELNARLHERERVRQELLRKVISAQEDERKRIARELHDETSQTLAALGIGVDTALATCSDQEVRQRLLELRRLVHRMHQELHRLIVNLRPSVLDDLGLAAAIRWMAGWHFRQGDTTVRCELEELEDLPRLPPEIETALFRAVQEAIVNISRHARAETVLIQGGLDNGTITLEIEDDGVGFDLRRMREDPSSLRGIGLLGMRERVEIIGGTLEIDSEPGRGTRLVIRVPLSIMPAVVGSTGGTAGPGSIETTTTPNSQPPTPKSPQTPASGNLGSWELEGGN